MPKHMVVRDEVVKKLDEIRENYNCSYSKAIELLFKRARIEDFTLLQINDKFEELKDLLPDLYYVIEIMRVIVVRLYKINRLERNKELKEKVGEMLEEMLAFIVGGKNERKMEENDRRRKI